MNLLSPQHKYFVFRIDFSALKARKGVILICSDVTDSSLAAVTNILSHIMACSQNGMDTAAGDFLKRFNTPTQGTGHSDTVIFVQEQGVIGQLHPRLLNTGQPGQVQPVKGRYQLDLFLMAILERLAGNPPAPDHAGELVTLSCGAAVVDRGGAQIPQRLSVAYHAEVMLALVSLQGRI